MITTLSSLLPTIADISFHKWCNSVGININPSTQLVTSQQSVAGRGVFAFDALEEGEVIARIPYGVIFHPENGASSFPDTAAEIRDCKSKAGILLEESSAEDSGIRSRILNRIRKLWRRQESRKFDNVEDAIWQSELTKYAIAAVDEDHPWAMWISQWQRDDPTYHLFASNAKPWDEDAISDTADELQSIMPDLSIPYLKAALSIRLNRLEEQRVPFGLDDNCSTSSLYSVLGSRACQLGEDTSGVIPFHDMINHSTDPNVIMAYEDKGVELVATREVEKCKELFLCYTTVGDDLDLNGALWALVQWGIPTSCSELWIDENVNN